MSTAASWPASRDVHVFVADALAFGTDSIASRSRWRGWRPPSARASIDFATTPTARCSRWDD
jgi:hypothetical protein